MVLCICTNYFDTEKRDPEVDKGPVSSIQDEEHSSLRTPEWPALVAAAEHYSSKAICCSLIAPLIIVNYW